jgi:protein SCO1/2
MSRLKNIIQKQGATMPNVKVLTFDTLRDTPEVIKTYVGHFNKAFVGITGEQAQIDKLIKPFGTYYERIIHDKNGKDIILKASEKLPKNAIKEGYAINHTA